MTSELPLDASKLPEIPDDLQPKEDLPRELPQALAEFKEYADAKWCYYSQPIENAEIINIQPKIAFQCQMMIYMETRELRMEVTPHAWQSDRILGSTTIGKFNSNIRKYL